MFYFKICFVKKFVSSKSMFRQNVCFVKKFVAKKSCFDEKFVSLSKSLFCRKVCFFEKFFSCKSFFRKKVFFVENFVSLIDFCQMVTFFGRNQCKISPWSQICWNFKDPTRIKWVKAILLSLKRPLQLSQELGAHEVKCH